ncbi:MAG: hypothetical protein KC443_24585 [Anaerolineales bacterium]|nr:hypothetical protein [Anaerolineales bacterium]
MRYFLGADLGSTKTHIAIADAAGQVVGFGKSGAGNPQSVGYDGMLQALQQGLQQAITQAQIPVTAVAGAGFGIAGYDWPSDRPLLAAVIDKLGLTCPIGMVNDAVPALFAAAKEGWGVCLVSGTGCNCRGWDKTHQREGRVTGYGYHMGEFAGAAELVWRAMQLVSFAWTKRGPETALAAALVDYAGASDLTDLLEGYTVQRYDIGAQAAPLIFAVAAQGDPVAVELIRWAGVELGEMANAVIRQLDFADLAFDVVLVGSMFDGGALLIDPMWQTITQLAPQARLVRMEAPPVLGAVIFGMEQGGLLAAPAMRQRLADTLAVPSTY